jgi:hypothetical protein
MFLVPDEGASVWAEFEGGNVQYPIWSGVWLAKSDPGEQPAEAKRLCESPLCQDCEDKRDHESKRPDHLEHAKYAHAHPPYYCPRRRVLVKTETGHTIVFDDRDEEEFLKVIDRAGQILHMDGRVRRSIQAGNAKARGERDAAKGDPLDIESDIADQRALVELLDVCRQALRLEAWKDEEKAYLLSCDRGRSRWQKILLDTTKGREKVRILGLGGEQEIVIDSTSGSERIVLTDKAGQTIEMNAAAGQESIRLTDAAGSQVTLDGASGNVEISAASMVLINA